MVGDLAGCDQEDQEEVSVRRREARWLMEEREGSG